MYLELLWVVHISSTDRTNVSPIDYDTHDTKFTAAPHLGYKFINYIGDTWYAGRFSEFYPQKRPTYSFPLPPSIPELIVYYLSKVCPSSPSTYLIGYTYSERVPLLDEIANDFKKICDLLDLIQ